MELEVKYHLFTNLSETILYEYIYPYIYQRQPQDLLNEINQFPSTKFDLYRVYDIPLEQNILYYDLISYMNRRSVSLIQIDKGRENILRRHHMLKDYSANKLLEFYTKYFSVNKKFFRKDEDKVLIGSSKNSLYLKKKFNFEFCFTFKLLIVIRELIPNVLKKSFLTFVFTP